MEFFLLNFPWQPLTLLLGTFRIFSCFLVIWSVFMTCFRLGLCRFSPSVRGPQWPFLIWMAFPLETFHQTWLWQFSPFLKTVLSSLNSLITPPPSLQFCHLLSSILYFYILYDLLLFSMLSSNLLATFFTLTRIFNFQVICFVFWVFLLF